MRKSLRIFSLLCLISITAMAQTNTWTGMGANGNWNTTGNWSLGIAPTADHDVVIPAGATANVNTAANTKSIAVQGNATLNIASNLSILNASTFEADATIHWNSGTISGGGALTNNGSIIFNSSASRYLSGETTLVNNSLMTMPSGGTLHFIGASILNNTADGVFDIQSNATVTYSSSTDHNFINAGLLKKTGGDGIATFSATLTNTGTISVEMGSLRFLNNAKTLTGGIYNVTTDAQLVIDAQVDVSGTLTGELDGPITWNDDVSVAGTATFDFTGDAQVHWNAGRLEGDGTLTNESTITFNSSASRYLSGETALVNNSLMAMPSGGTLHFIGSSSLNNTANGVFDIQSNATVTYSSSTDHNFLNAGLLKKTGSDGIATFSATLTNTGTISVETGDLRFLYNAKTLTNGIYNVSVDGQLIIDAQVNVSGILTGELAGPITWNNDVSVADTATFDFTGDAQVHWYSGQLVGGGTLTNESTITFNSSASRYLSDGTTLVNNNLMAMPSGGSLHFIGSSMFDNTANGVFDIQSDASVTYSSSTDHNFLNAGLLKKTGSDGTATFSATLTNVGTISVETGSLRFLNNAKTLTAGVYNVTSDGQLIIDTQVNVSGILTGELDGPITWNDDVSVADTATFDFTGDAQVHWYSGQLVGGGTLTNESTITFNSASSRYLSGGTTLVNNNLMAMPSNGSLHFIGSSVLNNTVDGVFDIQSDASVTYSSSTDHNFLNAGLLKKTGSDGTATFSATLTNVGTISVETGSLRFLNNAKTLTAGVYNVMSDGQLIIDTQVNVSGTLTGELDGPISWNDDVSVADTATFDFTGDVQVHWNSGQLVGGGILTNESTITFNSASSRYLSDGTTLVNNNLMAMPSNGSLHFIGSSVLNNTVDGVFDIQSDASVTYSSSTDHNFLNAGLLKKTGSDGTATFSATLTNTGTVSILSGELEVNGSFTNEQDGIVTGTGTLDLPSPANFTNHGIFAPGGNPGTLHVIGDFEASGTAVLDVELFGMTPDTQHDVLDITGNAAFEGSVNVSLNLEVNVDDEFVVATTTGNITNCGFVTTAVTEYDGYQYEFSVICRNDNEVVLTVTDKTLGVDEIALTASNIVIYPNPVRHILTIKNNSHSTLESASILDMTGKLLATFDLKSMGTTQDISLETYAAGMYLIRIESANNSITKQIIKQ